MNSYQTRSSPTPIREFFCGGKKRVASEEGPLLAPENELEKPVPLRNLLTRDIIVVSVNYALLALVDIAFHALQPLFLSTPIALGGLGLDPPMIGTVMSSFGVLNGVFTIFYFSRMTDYFGVKWVYLIAITATVPCFLSFPIINHLARNSIERSGGLGLEVWVVVGLQVMMSVLVCFGYGASVSKKMNYLWI